MTTTKTKPQTIEIIKEYIINAASIIQKKQDIKHLETMAKSILLKIAEKCSSPTALKREMKIAKDALAEAFKNAPAKYETEYKGHKNFCLISFLTEYTSQSLDNNNPDLRASDYPKIMQRIHQIAGVSDSTETISTTEGTEGIQTIEAIEEIQTIEATEGIQAIEVTEGIQAIKTTEATTEPIKLDASKLIEQATQLLHSDDWRDIAIAIAFLTGRRQVEATAEMDFLPHEEYSLIIPTPAKKKEEGNYYEIPCLIDSNEIEEASERLKVLTDFPRFKIQQNLGNSREARKEFNNCYKQPLLSRYNEVFRPLLNIQASVDYGNAFKEMRSIYTSIMREAKKQSYKPYSAKYDSQIVTFLKGCMVHESESATVKYGNWDIENVPDYLIEITNKTYGKVMRLEIKSHMKLVPFDLISLESMLRENERAYKLFSEQYIDKLNDPLALSKALVNLFEEAVRESDKKNVLVGMASPSTRRGDITTARIGGIIKAMMISNEAFEYKVFITESQIRAAYQYIYNETVNFNMVKTYIESLGSTVADHNQIKEVDVSSNLRLRGDKIKSVYENVKKILHDDL